MSVGHQYTTLKMQLVYLSLASFLSYAVCDKCPVSPPCTCQGTIIYCDHLNLTEVPKFNSTEKDTIWDVELHNNNIKRIRNGAFKNLKLQMLLLSDNELETVEDGAFDGSEDSLLVLDLCDNKFTSVPFAVSKMEQLMGLDIHNNPMPEVRQDVIQSISGTLSSIEFGNDKMTSWPYCLSLLRNLTSISVYDLDISEIPDDALENFPSLSSFEMISTKIRNIPSSLGTRTKMESLNLVDNPMLTAESFPKQDYSKLKNLMNMNIMNTSIQTLPNIFANLSGLYILQLRNNPISSIPNGIFPLSFSSKMWFLTLINTTLTNIPSALSNLTNLTRLDFMKSLVQEIRDDDFKNLIKLERIYFTENKLHTVSENAFKDLHSLKFLTLDNTTLTNVPRAIRNLPSLQELSLANAKVECICTNFAWIKDWKRKSKVEIYGSCVNIRMTIASYIYKELPKCE